MKFLKQILILLSLGVFSYSIYNNYEQISDTIENVVFPEQSNSEPPDISKSEPYEDYKFDNVEYITDKYSYVEKISFPRSVESIIKSGVLVVCAKQDDKNGVFQIKLEDGRYVGKDVDFAKKMADTLGVRLIYKMIYKNQDELVEAVAKGEGDIGIAKISFTTERSRKVLFSSPYVTSQKTILINRSLFEKSEQSNLRQILSDPKTSISVSRGTSYVDFTRDIFPKSNLKTCEDWEKMIIEDMQTGKITATMRDAVTIGLLLKQHKNLLLRLIPVSLKDEEDSISAIVDIQNSGLLLWTNKFIEVAQIVDESNKVLDKYDRYVQ